MTTSWKRTDHRSMDGHDPKCATFRALPFFQPMDVKSQARFNTCFVGGSVKGNPAHKALTLDSSRFRSLHRIFYRARLLPSGFGHDALNNLFCRHTFFSSRNPFRSGSKQITLFSCTKPRNTKSVAKAKPIILDWY